MMISAKIKPYTIAGIFFLLFLALVRAVFFLHCSSYYDLGIYSDALHWITLQDLNPFIPGRNIHIFNDHFDPILIPFAMIEHFVPAPILGMVVEFSLVALCWFPLKFLRDKNKISTETAIFGYAFVILNHAMINAIQTPFHPTTWACLPLMYVFAFYWVQYWRAMLVALVVLFTCREEFPLVGLSLGAVLLADKKTRIGLTTLALSVAWCVFVFVIRPKVFAGESPAYGANLLHDFFQHPLAPLWAHLNLGMIRMLLSRVLALVLVLQWKPVRKYNNHALKILLIAAPIFGIRFVSTQWAFHYGTAPIIALLFALLPALDDSLKSVRMRKKNLAWLFILIIFVSPVVKGFGGSSDKRCPADSSRRAEIEAAQTVIQQDLTATKVLVENNLVATQMLKSWSKSPQQKIYIVSGIQGPEAGPFDYVLVEKPPHGDPWPTGQDQMGQLIQKWRNLSGIKVITDNDQIFLGQGKITLDRPAP